MEVLGATRTTFFRIAMLKSWRFWGREVAENHNFRGRYGMSAWSGGVTPYFEAARCSKGGCRRAMRCLAYHFRSVIVKKLPFSM